MQRGINKILRDGRPLINADLSVSVLDETGQEIHRLAPEALTQGGIGYVFERLTCLHYERLGYFVEQRSNLGYFDRGVDLIANKDNERVFIQCKFSLQAMSKSKVEALLFAASSFVRQNLSSGQNFFDLAILSEEIIFPVKKSSKCNTTRMHPGKSAFLRYNRTQSLAKLRIVEIPIDLPHSFNLGA